MKSSEPKWIYQKTPDNKARFVLGEEGNNPLVCIGVNPSTAEPNHLDPTLKSVKRWADKLRFDGWIMLNLYSLRATDPGKLPVAPDLQLHSDNLIMIRSALDKYDKLTVWAAWGNTITKRAYLKKCLRDIVQYALRMRIEKYLHVGPLTKGGHPHHPLYLSKGSSINYFNILEYIALKEKPLCSL